MSSTEAPVGLTIMEKLVGLLLIAIGAITFYATYTNLIAAGVGSALFLIVSLILVIVGILLVIAQTETE